MNRVVITFVGVVLLSGVCLADEKTVLKDDNDRVNYSVGYQIGGDFKRQGVELSAEMLVKGIRDAVSGTEPLMTPQEMSQTLLDLKRKILALQKAERKKIADQNLADGKRFLEENAEKEGVKTLPGGLQYRVVREGAGAVPAATDTVTVHYRGTLIDGTEFDSSYGRGKPATFQLGRVIKGWTQALQLMKQGAKWQLFIPPDLAYGDRPSGRIPANSTLIFEVELISVEPSKQ